MHKLKIFLVLTLLVFVQVSCNTTDPKLEPELLLKLEDVSCTEAWLRLTTNNIQLPATINLLKNNSVTQTFSLSTKDSLLFIDSLLPNQNYSFQVSSILHQVSSNELVATTLDTTSHNFTWQTFEFGQHSSSVLYDVAIINENDIWAVGEIYMNDSLGNPDPNSYNAIHWNGQSWELKKIGGYGGWACHTVFAFTANDIWFEGTIHWNGASYNVYKNGWPLMPNGDGWQVNKMWGSSSNDLYAVGNNGNIARYNGSSWTKIESGTSLPINDIYGRENPENGKLKILCVAADAFTNSGVRAIKINSSNTVEQVNTTGLKWSISSVWFLTGYKYFIVGNGLFNNSVLGAAWLDLNENRTITQNYMDFIRGTGFNNIIVVGAFGEVIHFNGVHWKSIKDDQTTLTNGSYFKVDVKGQIIVSVGYNNSKAVILLGLQL